MEPSSERSKWERYGRIGFMMSGILLAASLSLLQSASNAPSGVFEVAVSILIVWSFVATLILPFDSKGPHPQVGHVGSKASSEI
jgi:hypothetical protein